MSTLLERYARQAVTLGSPLERELRTRPRASDLEDVMELAHMESGRWKAGMNDLLFNGVPMALAGGFAGLEINPNAEALATVTMGATELAIWPTTWTPTAAVIQAPKVYQLMAFCTVTTSATSTPTMTVVPRVGTSNAGTALGADAQISLTANITAAPVIITGHLIVRTGGSLGSAMGAFRLVGKFAAATNGAVGQHDIFGFTAASSINFEAASALWMGVTSTITTPTIIPQGVVWGSWN